MKKKIYSLATIAIILALHATPLRAQVTIGDLKNPEQFSILELISGGSRGMRLPQLTTEQREDLEATFGTEATGKAMGLQIFNLDTKCVETWNGSVWIQKCGPGGPVIPCSDAPAVPTVSITGKQLRTMRATNNDAAIFTDVTSDVTITAEAGATVNWTLTPIYGSDATSHSFSSADTGTSTSFSLTAFDTPLHSDNKAIGGIYELAVTCTNNCGATVKKDTIIVGCGAKTTTSTWLKFMCHNLGADQTLDPFVWVCTSSDEGNGVSDDGTADIKGDMYQWGRYTDGHENRQSTYSTTGHPLLADYDNEVLAYKTSGTAFSYIAFYEGTSTRNYDWISDGASQNNASLRKGWGDATTNLNQTKAANDPCPPGWKVPSQAQWGSIFSGGTTSGTANSATANSWWYTGTFHGYMVGSSLYLPAAGYRYYSDGALDYVGSYGYYWSSTWTSDTGSSTLFFYSSGVYPGSNSSRASGFSVRCVAE